MTGNPPRPADLVFDAEAHRYTVAGHLLPSVTQILAPLYDLSAIPAAVLDHKRQIGQAVHAAIDILDQGQELDPDSLDPEIVGYVNAWQKFKAEHGWTIVASEWQGYHPALGYAGTLDKVMTKPDATRVLLDAKSTVDMHPAIGPQTAAYAAFWNHWNPALRITQRYGLQLRPDGTYRLHPYRDADDAATFNAALTLHHWRTKHGY